MWSPLPNHTFVLRLWHDRINSYSLRANTLSHSLTECLNANCFMSRVQTKWGPALIHFDGHRRMKDGGLASQSATWKKKGIAVWDKGEDLKWKEGVIQEALVSMKGHMRQMLPFPTPTEWPIPSISLSEISVSLFLELGRMTGCLHDFHSFHIHFYWICSTLKQSKMVPSMRTLSWSLMGIWVLQSHIRISLRQLHSFNHLFIHSCNQPPNMYYLQGLALGSMPFIIL